MFASDLFGRREILVVCTLLGVIGPFITATAHSFNVAIVGQCLLAFGPLLSAAGYAIPSEVLRKASNILELSESRTSL